MLLARQIPQATLPAAMAHAGPKSHLSAAAELGVALRIRFRCEPERCLWAAVLVIEMQSAQPQGDNPGVHGPPTWSSRPESWQDPVSCTACGESGSLLPVGQGNVGMDRASPDQLCNSPAVPYPMLELAALNSILCPAMVEGVLWLLDPAPTVLNHV